jgi:hypothetical protein
MPVTYKNSSGQITIGQAIWLRERSIDVIINDGKDVTFKITFKGGEED